MSVRYSYPRCYVCVFCDLLPVELRKGGFRRCRHEGQNYCNQKHLSLILLCEKWLKFRWSSPGGVVQVEAQSVLESLLVLVALLSRHRQHTGRCSLSLISRAGSLAKGSRVRAAIAVRICAEQSINDQPVERSSVVPGQEALLLPLALHLAVCPASSDVLVAVLHTRRQKAAVGRGCDERCERGQHIRAVLQGIHPEECDTTTSLFHEKQTSSLKLLSQPDAHANDLTCDNAAM
jgi:hypothetical protein